MELLQEFRISSELFSEQRALLWTELERLSPVDPIEILQNRTRILARLVLWILPTDGTSLQIIRLVDILVRREEIVHDDKVDFSAMRELDTMKAIKPGKKRVGIVLHVLVVLFEDRAEELVLRVMDGLDDEAVVSGEVEEGAGFTGRAKL